MIISDPIASSNLMCDNVINDGSDVRMFSAYAGDMLTMITVLLLFSRRSLRC